MPGKVYRRDSDATHSPMFHQVEGLAIGEGITLADLQGTLEEMLRAIFGARREARMRPALLPVHRAERRVRRLLLRRATGPAARRRRALRPLQGDRLDRGRRRRDGRPRTCSASSRDNGYDPERVQGFAFGMGVERIAMLRHGVPDLRRFFDNDVRVLEQFSMKVPYSWLREHCDPGIGAEELAERLAMTGTEVERVGAGRPARAASGFVVGRVLTREQHPDADRLSVCTVDTGDARAAHDRLRGAQRRRRPDRRRGAARGDDAGRRRSSARRSSAASPPTG